MKYATRLNSFASRPEKFWGAANYKPSALELIQRASKVNGLSEVDLNFPDHFAGTPEDIISAARDLGLTVNGLAMRYYSEPEFKLGAFTNPDSRVRQSANRSHQESDGRSRTNGGQFAYNLARPRRLGIPFRSITKRFGRRKPKVFGKSPIITLAST